MTAAFAPNFGWLVVARVFLAMGLPVFWVVATVTAAQLVPEQQKSRAVTTVFARLPVANMLSVPFGTFIADILNWRMTFLAMCK